MAVRHSSFASLESVVQNASEQQRPEGAERKLIMKPGSNRKIGIIQNKINDDLQASNVQGERGSERSILKNKIVPRNLTEGLDVVQSGDKAELDGEKNKFVKMSVAKQVSSLSGRKILPSKIVHNQSEAGRGSHIDISSKLEVVEKGLLQIPEDPSRDPNRKISNLDASPNGSAKRKLMKGKKALMLELQESPPADTVTVNSELQRSQSIAMIDYFTDEVANMQNRNKINNKYFYYTSEVMFSVDQYLEFFIHHLLYFAVLGPLSLLARLFSKKMYYLHSNIQLYKLNKFGIFQNLNFVLSMCIYYGYFVAEKGKFASLDTPMLRTMLLSLLLMTTSIAGKYATYPRILIKKFKETKITSDDFEREHMLGNWKTQTLDVRNLEINSALERLEVDESIFFLAFMVEPSEIQMAKLQETYDEIITEFDDHRALITTYMKGRKLVRYYHGRYLFDMMLKEYKLVMGSRSFGYNFYSVAVSLIWASANIVLRVLVGEKHILGSTWFDTTVCIIVSLATTMLFFMKFRFYLQAIIDLERRTYMMNQCGFLLSPLRIKDHIYDKVFPTVNILDKTSLLSWLQMRRIAIDYGRKYFYRHELFLPVSFMISVFAMILIGAILYCHLKLGMFEDRASEILRLVYLLILDSVVFGFMSFHFMYTSGGINSQFSEHIVLLKNNRAILADLLNYKDYYFYNLLPESARANKANCSFEMELVKTGISESQSFLHEKLKSEIAAILADRLESCLSQYLESTIQLYTDLVSKLKDEEEHYSIQLLGVVVTKNSVLNLLIALVSVVLTAWQLFFGF